MNYQDKTKLSELVLKSLDGSITDQQRQQLNEMLRNNREAAIWYLEFVDVMSCLSKYGTAGITEITAIAEEHIENTLKCDFDENISLWRALAEEEKNAPVVEIEKPVPTFEPVKMLKVDRQPREIRKSSIFTAVLSIAAMLLIVLMVQLKPVVPTVASLTDSMNAKWGNAKRSPINGDVLRQGRWNLTKGLAEITFDDGAVVVVEAPAVFDLESPKSMYLDSGKINAFVSKYAIGFTVNTPSASIVDLGTEFGVDVQFDGTCDMQMFSGKANLVIGQEGQEKTSQLVNIKEAKNVDGRTGRVRNIAMQKNRFVRRIDSATGLVWKGQDLSLVDIVGGGNGFGTGKQHHSINMFNGIMAGPMHTPLFNGNSERKGPDGITPVSHPFIDCVFVPDVERNLQISTLGHAFKECPKTNGHFHEFIFIGPESPELSIARHLLYLNNIQQGTAEHPALSVHSNTGITFDLEIIRRTNPEMKISAFKSLCGLSQNASRDNSRNTAADMWVLVDGKIRGKAVGIQPASEPTAIDIELKDEDRFLTLVSTDNDGETHDDWCLFANPVLVTD